MSTKKTNSSRRLLVSLFAMLLVLSQTSSAVAAPFKMGKDAKHTIEHETFGLTWEEAQEAASAFGALLLGAGVVGGGLAPDPLRSFMLMDEKVLQEFLDKNKPQPDAARTERRSKELLDQSQPEELKADPKAAVAS